MKDTEDHQLSPAKNWSGFKRTLGRELAQFPL